MSGELPEALWAEISSVIEELLRGGTRGLSPAKYMAIYTMLHDYLGEVLSKAVFLYDRLAELFAAAPRAVAQAGAELTNADLLPFYVHRWRQWQEGTRAIVGMSAPLALSGVKVWLEAKERLETLPHPRAEVLPIFLLADAAWRDGALLPLAPRLTERITELVEDEREGAAIPRDLVRDALRSYVKAGVNKTPREGVDPNPLNPATYAQPLLGVYQKEFEEPFLAATRRYYQGKAARTLKEGGSVYVRSAEAWLANERERAEAYLGLPMVDPLLSVYDEVCLAEQRESLLSFFSAFLRAKARDNLRSLYVLLPRLDGGLAEGQAMFHDFVIEEGTRALESARGEMRASPALYVEPLLRLLRLTRDLVADAFRGDSRFKEARDRALRRLVNTAPPASGNTSSSALAAILLAEYLDGLLTLRGRAELGEAREELLDDLASFFRYLADKDLFAIAYARLLGRRLLSRRSASVEEEQEMVGRLRAEQGPAYVRNLQQMLGDILVSGDLQVEFGEFVRGVEQEGEARAQRALQRQPLQLRVAVLGKGAWPSAIAGKPAEFVYPEVARQPMERYREFYALKFQGRTLQFVPELETFEVEWQSGRKRYTLVVSAHQLGVLLLFDTQDLVTVDEMVSATHLDIEHLRQALEPMVTLGVLIAEDGPDPRVWTLRSAFRLNERFQPPGRRPQTRVVLNVPKRRPPRPEKAGEEELALQRQAAEERMNSYKAAIVRIMKARKTLPHSALVAETVDQVRRFFSPSVPAIKRAIEWLLAGEFLRRAPENKDVYEYVA